MVSTICEYILVSKQVSVSTDTNVQSIGIELKILVSPITSDSSELNVLGIY